MKRAIYIPLVFLLTGLLPGGARAVRAASLDVDFGQTIVVSNGAVYDSAVVRNGGVLILDGGAIGTNALPSVNVEAGGRFVVYDGEINYFDNRGSVELYGGRQSTYSSENRGYLRIAGGDPGTRSSTLTAPWMCIPRSPTARPGKSTAPRPTAIPRSAFSACPTPSPPARTPTRR